MSRSKHDKLSPYQLGIIQNRASRHTLELRETVLKTYGLSSPEWFVLGHVASHTKTGGVKVGSIASMLDVNSTYVTGILRRLEAQGLTEVKPDKDDRRIRIVTTTKKGARQAKKIDEEFIKQSKSWLGTASLDAIQQYQAILRIIDQDTDRKRHS